MSGPLSRALRSSSWVGLSFTSQTLKFLIRARSGFRFRSTSIRWLVPQTRPRLCLLAFCMLWCGRPSIGRVGRRRTRLQRWSSRRHPPLPLINHVEEPQSATHNSTSRSRATRFTWVSSTHLVVTLLGKLPGDGTKWLIIKHVILILPPAKAIVVRGERKMLTAFGHSEKRKG